MPKPPPKKAVAPKVKKTKLNLQIRHIMGDAYSFILSEKFIDQVNAVSLESLMSEQINLVEGSDGVTAIRMNKKSALEKLVTQLTTAAAQLKKIPPKAFKVEADERASDPSMPAQANTPKTKGS